MKKAGLRLWTVAILAVAVGLASYRYLLPGTPGAPPTVLANHFNQFGALVFHATLSATALILGAVQFFPAIRARWPAWHRRAGTVYVGCSLIGGAVALVLALGTTSGPVGSAGFGLLALSWLGATVNAWRLARARDFVRHERWMVRSYALTFAAVTLRLYLPIAAIAHVDFMTGYRAISFLCWVPNVIVAELILARRRPARGLLARAAVSPGSS
ncbi:MAG TPA: DUF2306 domain-containing protein [Caulobacteraceae bacterium]